MPDSIVVHKYKKRKVTEGDTLIVVHYTDLAGVFRVHMALDTNEGNKARFKHLVETGEWQEPDPVLSDPGDEEMPF
jgi:hypothetical protein